MELNLNTMLDILKVAVGLIYLYLEYKAMRQMWIASVIMPMIGMWLFFNKGLYADCAINIYYLAIAVYGWWVWSRGGKPDKNDGASIAPKHVPVCTLAWLLLGWVGVWGLIYLMLTHLTDSNVPVLDSFTTSLSIVGMWMLARKYIEQWMVWLIVDAVYVWLYYKKGIYFSGTLYAFYTLMTIPGYLKWRRLMLRAATGSNPLD